MKPVIRLRLLVLLGLLVWLVLAWFLGARLGGTHYWLLRIGLALIGAIAAGFLLWYYRPAPAPDEVRLAEAAIELTLGDARRRLRAARGRGARRFRDVPLVVVLGPAGSAKTTTVLHAGLAPELLAGEVFRGDLVAPTQGANAWLADASVVIEAGGPLLESPAAWKRLLRYLPAGRWRAALTGRAQAPRVALVCLSCEELTQESAAEKVVARARELRQRLMELSEALRVRLPVYVLFTKLDRVPHFDDFVRPLTTEEVREAFGALLPAEAPAGSGWAEHMHRRVQDMLNSLFGSLATRRLLVLGREPGSPQAASAFEFPREFRKLAAPITEFLLELGKPSQLQAVPFIRGFHFAGVRPVLAQEVAGSLSGSGAPAVPDSSRRRVPQWVFLDRFLPKVVLADHVALGITRSGHGVHLLRRFLLATATVLALVYTIGLLVSAVENRDLADRAGRVVHGAATLDASVGGVPTPASLARLDSLRAVAATVSRQAHGSRPLRYRWGLSQAATLYPPVRQAYFRAFERLLFEDTRRSLRAGLRGLPAAQSDQVDYGKAYDRLKAYLIVVRDSDKSTPSFLGPELYGAWSDGRGSVDPAVATTARAQFDFLGEELPWGNPYAAVADTAAINVGRRYLSQFGGSNRILQTMISEASRAEPSVVFAKLVPSAAGVMTVTHDVPGAFTKRGWDFMQKALKGGLDRFLKSESWVVGDDAAPPPDRAQLVRTLDAAYRAEYLRQWQAFIRSASVARFGSYREASSKLATLASNQSPLLALFGITALHTGVDSGIAQVFRSAQMMAPPFTGGSLVNAGNEPYVSALGQLQAAVNLVATTTAEGRMGAAQSAQAKATEANAAADAMARKFPVDTLQIHSSVRNLLLAPVAGVDAELRNVGSRDVNDAAQVFCGQIRGLMGKYPFASSSATRASMDEVVAAFEPQQGQIWAFARERLQGVVARQGAGINVRPGTGPSITQDARGFFTKAAEVTDALFRDNSQEPRLFMTLKPELSAAVPDVSVEIDGTNQRFTRTANSNKQYEWNGKRAQSVTVSVTPGGGAPEQVSFRGPWALFEFFRGADLRPDGGSTWRAEFTKPKLTLQLNLNGALPIFRRDYFAQWRCPSTMLQ